MVDRTTIGEASVRFSGDNDDLLKAVRENTAALRRQNDAFGDAGESVDRFGNRITLAAAAVTALATVAAGFAVREFAQFEDTITRVGVVIGATEREFEQLRDLAEELGSSTRFSAQEAAGGLQFLAQAGFSANEALSALPTTLALAQVGGLDLASAADIATNILTGFNLEVQELQRVVDVMAATANSANTNVGQLGVAFSFAAPAARALGVSIEEAAAVVGVLSDAGIQGARAGTGLRQIMVSLTGVSGQAAAALAEAGLSAEDYNIQAIGLTQVLNNLAEANLTLEQATAVFNSRNAASVLAITNSIAKYNELVEASKDVEGATEAIVDVLDNTLVGAFKNTTSAISGLAIRYTRLSGLGNTIRDVFFDIAEALNRLIDRLDDSSNIFRLFGTAASAAVNVIGDVIVLIIDNLELVTKGVLALLALFAYNRFVLPFVTGVGGWSRALVSLQGVITITTRLLRVMARAFIPLLIIEGIIQVIDAFRRIQEVAVEVEHTVSHVGVVAGAEFAIRFARGVKTAFNLALTGLGQFADQFIQETIELGIAVGDIFSSIGRAIALAIRGDFAGAGEAIASEAQRIYDEVLTVQATDSEEDFRRRVANLIGITREEYERIRNALAAEQQEFIGASDIGITQLPAIGINNAAAPVTVDTTQVDNITQSYMAQAFALQSQRDIVRSLTDDYNDILSTSFEQLELSGLEGAALRAREFQLQQLRQIEERRLELSRQVRDAEEDLRLAQRTGAGEEIIAQLQQWVTLSRQIEAEETAILDRFEQIVGSQERLNELRQLFALTTAEPALERELDLMRQQEQLLRSTQDAVDNTLNSVRQRVELARLEGPAREARRFELQQEENIRRQLLQSTRRLADAQRDYDRAVSRGAAGDQLEGYEQALENARNAHEALNQTAAMLPAIVQQGSMEIEAAYSELEAIENFKNSVREVSGAVTQFITDTTSGAKDIGEAFNDLARRVLTNLITKFIEAQIQALLLGEAFGGVGGGVGGGLLGGLFGFQQGGRPEPGRPAIVGEGGPEIFVPDRAGTILPNAALASGLSGTALTFVYSPTVPRDEPGIRRAVRSVYPEFEANVRSGLTTDAGRRSQFRDQIRQR